MVVASALASSYHYSAVRRPLPMVLRTFSRLACPMESILEDISPEVANINVPTVLLAGVRDQVDSIERHKTEVLAYLPNAEFNIIKRSGHLIPIDEPMQLAKEIASFTTRLAG